MSAAADELPEERVVLVVDDEPALVEVLSAYLRDEGFRVVEAADGRAAVAVARAENPDIILLDLNLPLVSGVEAFREIRARSNVPVIMLTSRVNEVDRIVGLELGADDYVSKPFSPREVVARVKAVLRRARPARAPLAGERDVQRIGPIEIDRSAHEVRRRGVDVELTPTEFRVFETLAANVGHALTREQILERISTDGDIYDRTLDRHVANLRHKIEDEPGRPRLVLTVVGVGYKLVDPARNAGR
jgi:two-component system response regulator AdeR